MRGAEYYKKSAITTLEQVLLPASIALPVLHIYVRSSNYVFPDNSLFVPDAFQNSPICTHARTI